MPSFHNFYLPDFVLEKELEIGILKMCFLTFLSADNNETKICIENLAVTIDKTYVLSMAFTNNCR